MVAIFVVWLEVHTKEERDAGTRSKALRGYLGGSRTSY